MTPHVDHSRLKGAAVVLEAAYRGDAQEDWQPLFVLSSDLLEGQVSLIVIQNTQVAPLQSTDTVH